MSSQAWAVFATLCAVYTISIIVYLIMSSVTVGL